VAQERPCAARKTHPRVGIVLHFGLGKALAVAPRKGTRSHGMESQPAEVICGQHRIVDAEQSAAGQVLEAAAKDYSNLLNLLNELATLCPSGIDPQRNHTPTVTDGRCGRSRRS
jgi:hypothetical protein